jgi:hypothetical protein
MTKISWPELTISRSLRALAIAQTQASAIAPADDRFRAGCATELAIALATKRKSATERR